MTGPKMLVIRRHRVVLPDGVRAAALHIDHGVIERIVDEPNAADLDAPSCGCD